MTVLCLWPFVVQMMLDMFIDFLSCLSHQIFMNAIPWNHWWVYCTWNTTVSTLNVIQNLLKLYTITFHTHISWTLKHQNCNNASWQWNTDRWKNQEKIINHFIYRGLSLKKNSYTFGQSLWYMVIRQLCTMLCHCNGIQILVLKKTKLKESKVIILNRIKKNSYIIGVFSDICSNKAMMCHCYVTNYYYIIVCIIWHTIKAFNSVSNYQVL